MPLPKKVKIINEWYTIEEVQTRDNKEPRWGLIDYGDSKIEVDNTLAKSKMPEVLMHEIVHGIFDKFQTFGDEEQDERVVDNATGS
jgi:hypothetical protein